MISLTFTKCDNAQVGIEKTIQVSGEGCEKIATEAINTIPKTASEVPHLVKCV